MSAIPAYASLSLDLDNMWSYLKTHGDPAWSAFPSYLDVAVPRILDYLERRKIRITFFVVGQDATIEANRRALRSIAEAGHDIGNHSFNHEPWLHLYDDAKLDEELARAEQAIESATGVRPTGFRGPGFSLSEGTLRVLAKRGYAYDATVFPNLLNPLARAYFFATSRLTDEEKEQRKALFGTWKDALRPVKPFCWELGESRLLELPVTTMPVFKVPIHLSYVIYASRFSKLAARAYWRMGLAMCRLTHTEPSILLHPLDFLGPEDAPQLHFFPGMDMSVASKLAILDDVLDTLGRHHQLVDMRTHVAAIVARAAGLPRFEASLVQH